MYTLRSKKWQGLAKLSEEMGELQQVLSKIIENNGSLDYWDKDLKIPLIEELGDVAAAYDFFCFANLTHEDLEAIDTRSHMKAKKYKKWSND
jgi:NTP pyrophosphatase (non-canonical NTP hydrolase)